MRPDSDEWVSNQSPHSIELPWPGQDKLTWLPSNGTVFGAWSAHNKWPADNNG